MAKTNYKVCWWLIQAVTGEFGSGSYMNGQGYSLNHLFKLLHHKDFDVVDNTIKDKFRHDVMRWRAIIYNQFGLAIQSDSTQGKIKGKGDGGYFYYLENGELLEEEGMKLRDLIEHLANCETDYYGRVSLTEMSRNNKGGTSTMGFLSSGGASYGFLSNERTAYRTILGEENLELVQFAMQFGEVLTIKYGKVRSGIDINEPYSFEPQQVKEIEGRWYVIGNLYPIGLKDDAELAVYDLARLEFADEENPDIHFEPIDDYDVSQHVVVDYVVRRHFGLCVLMLHVTVHSEELVDYFKKHPLCRAQEWTDENSFRVYTSFDLELALQLGAYGEELSFKCYAPITEVEVCAQGFLNSFRKSSDN